jgi:hypothetical protein
MQSHKSLRWNILFLGTSLVLSGCYVFRKRGTHAPKPEQTSSPVLGLSLGAKAGGADPEALEQLYALTSPYPPAGVRSDPDLFVRRLLLQYRSLGSTLAMEIGRVENYRLLLGGANETFAVAPQETYDATSLLAQLKVAEELCTGLVNPNGWSHRGWQTILPYPPAQSALNIRFLMQRMIGLPDARLDEAAQSKLETILEATRAEGELTLASYVPVCATLLIDAEGLLL